MSLTSFLARPDVRERMRKAFPKPRLSVAMPLVAPPLSKRYSLIGTAFDYLFRFHLERLNPKAVSRRWVAESGLERLQDRAVSRTTYDADSGQLTFPDDDGSAATGRVVLKRAKSAHQRFLKSGVVTTALLKSAIYLAQLDVVIRTGFVDDNLGVAHAEDLCDLRRLISLVDLNLFRAKRRCLLNPTFGDSSRLVGGADADVVIDEMLIDLKVTKNFELTREHLNQLIGYFALHELSGIDGGPRVSRISRVAVYFARHAHLEMIDLGTIANGKSFPAFLKWFSDAVEGQARNRPLSRSRPAGARQSRIPPSQSKRRPAAVRR